MTTAPATTPAMTGPGEEPRPAGVVMLAQAEWPAGPGDVLPPVPGFIVSSFSPLVIEVAGRCLSRYFGAAPADPARGERTAVVVASSTGDIATAVAIAAAVDEGSRVQPLLFFQSNPNAAVGHLTARWGLAGPVVCTVPGGEAMADARHCATLLIEGGDADAVLIVLADQARDPGQRDQAAALLIGPRSWPAAAAGLDFPAG